MKAEIINTGKEILRGQILNTHQQWLCQKLTALGIEVIRQISIPDDSESIIFAIEEALSRASLIIITGGLGPTEDDRTREAIAALLGRRLVEDVNIRKHIELWYTSRGRIITPELFSQAKIPEGAIIFYNEWGTAPGWIIEISYQETYSTFTKYLLALPGPPRELQPMFTTKVIPWLKNNLNLEAHPRSYIIIRSTGIPESIMEAKIKEVINNFPPEKLQIGYCARPGEVDITVEAEGTDAFKVVQEAKNKIESVIGENVYGYGEEELEQVIVRLLKEKKQLLATAESCTGGLLSHRITNVAGASEIFVGGIIAYSNFLKNHLLGIPLQLLETYGAVSEVVAKAMAEEAKTRFNTDWAIGITGIAGPSGGSPEKPVGTVFIAVAGPSSTVVRKKFNSFDRQTFKWVTTQQALDMLRRCILGLPIE